MLMLSRCHHGVGGSPVIKNVFRSSSNNPQHAKAQQSDLAPEKLHSDDEKP
jgi:hypothetical protein